MNKEKDHQLIEEYLDGSLAGTARINFEARIKTDKALADEIALYQEVNEHLNRLSEKENLKKKWKNIIADTESKSQKSNVVPISKNKTGYYLMRIAAVFVFGLGLYFLIPRSISPEQLAMDYWEQTAQFQYTGSEKTTDVLDTYQKNLKSAYVFFNENNYLETIEKLNAMSPATNEMLLLNGAAYFLLDEPDEAIGHFNKISEKTSEYDEAQWYLALSYLQKEDITNSKILLEHIVQNKTWHYKEASELLEKIN